MTRKNNKNNTNSSDEKINPFEVHINRTKYKILGQKTKDDRGLPGVSRAKAFHNRKKTLQNEFMDRHKNSKFLDKRIGENNSFMDPEKKIMMRMVAEKKRQFSKKSRYILNDEEELLHDGKSLNESIMKDKSTFSDDEDDDDLIDAKFVKDQHFGGDLFTKPKEGKQDETDNSAPKSRKEWIDDMIVESKKKKTETKMEKEFQHTAVTKLDEKFKGFLMSMKGWTMTDEDKEQSKKTCEFRDYDMLVRELLFDRSKRAQPVNRLKTEEEIAKEEHERLQKLEEERKRRMLGEDNKAISYQKSADALDDGLTYFDKTPISLEDIKQIHGKKDEILIHKGEKDKIKIKKKKNIEKEEEINDEVEEKEEEMSDEEEEEEMSDEEEEEEMSDEEQEEEEEKEEDDTEEQEEMEEDKIEEAMENTEDEEEEEDGEEEETEEQENNKVQSKTKCNSKLEIKDKSIRKKSRNFDELPYTFEVPKEYDDFWDLIENQTPFQVSTILERMIKCNHPSLGADNKAKVNTIFVYILQTLQNVCSTDPEIIRSDNHPFSYISPMVSHLFTLTQLSPNECAKALNEVLDEKYEEYQSQNIRRYPYFDTFVFLKVSGLLFPPSDLHHMVMTRVLTFLAQLLYESKVSCGRDIISLLFTSGVLIEYVTQSHRFIGELANALNGILYLAIPKKNLNHNLPINPPFKSFGPLSELLVVSELCPSYEKDPPQLKLCMINEDINITNTWKIKFVDEALRQLNKLCKIWENSPAVRSIFLPTTNLIKHLPIQFYPQSLLSSIKCLKKSISNLPKQVPHLRKEETVMKTLKMIDPCIKEMTFDLKKRSGNKELQEKQKLLYKLKRERKGVKRELKRDAQFLARLQLKEVLEKDAERKRKVNLIMQGLSTQESEFKKFKSQK